jgi:hypothetical protein
MTNLTTISFDLGTTSPTAGLGLEVWLDNNKLYDNIVSFESSILSFEFEDNEADHELRFIMKNKTIEHTKIDEAGNILTDARLTIANVAFDEIKLGYILTEQAVYTHNFNETAPETQQKFYGEIGCNGTVNLRFTTPIYLWLLEHM